MNCLSMPFSALGMKERLWLANAAKEAEMEFGPGAVIVNIGVEYGCSLHCLRKDAPGASLYGIDLDNTLLIGEPGAHLITGDSGDVHQAFDKSIHLLFIDGGHDYKTVWGDIAGWSPKVVIGGLMVFHDFHDVHGGVAEWIKGVGEAAQEWAAGACWDGGWKAVEKVSSIQAYRRVPIGDIEDASDLPQRENGREGNGLRVPAAEKIDAQAGIPGAAAEGVERLVVSVPRG